jgi:hypothetical protein
MFTDCKQILGAMNLLLVLHKSASFRRESHCLLSSIYQQLVGGRIFNVRNNANKRLISTAHQLTSRHVSMDHHNQSYNKRTVRTCTLPKK